MSQKTADITSFTKGETTRRIEMRDNETSPEGAFISEFDNTGYLRESKSFRAMPDQEKY